MAGSAWPEPAVLKRNSTIQPTTSMKLIKHPLSARQAPAKIGWILLWLLGIPLPVLLIIYFIKGH